jgi:hypothetical protein
VDLYDARANDGGYVSRSLYRIAFVARGQEDIWRKYWLNPAELSKNAQSANRAGALGRTDLVEACSLEEAVAIAGRRHSNCTVMAEGSQKICLNESSPCVGSGSGAAGQLSRYHAQEH